MMEISDTVASAGPYANNLHLTPESRQISRSTPHHSIFTGRMLFLTPTEGTIVLQFWKSSKTKQMNQCYKDISSFYVQVAQ